MPPKQSQATSMDLVQTGPKHMAQVGPSKGRKGSLMRPTTSRALVLRNGKYGTMGAGELVPLRKKFSGREKLDLLAEDLVQRAIMAPFRLEECLNIANSQFDAYLDDIANLKDSALFCDLVSAELEARSPVDPQSKAKMLQNPSYIASTIATMIHNKYMLAAAWKIVLDTLVDLVSNGLTDDNIKTKLKTNSYISLRYLILYDMVGTLVNLKQAQFAALAITTPHYMQYFKRVDDAMPDEPDIKFDWNGLREAYLSFIDSIIIELCFPRAPYPMHILFSILRDAVEEAPNEAKRFPQALWDAVGDFSATVRLHSIIEAPLLGTGSDYWKNTARAMPEKYEQWVDAQIYSTEASSKCANFANLVNPLDKTKQPSILQELWRKIDLNYKSVAHKGIDALWGLAKSFHITPQWHAFHMPFLRFGSDLDNSVPETKKQALVIRNRKVAVESDSDDSTPSSLPSLWTVSGSSEESDDIPDDSVDKCTDDESGCDTDEEEDLRDLLRAAMDVACETDFYNSTNLNVNLDTSTSEKAPNDNPFLKLLGSLRGRLFSSDPKLKVIGRSEFRKPKTTGAIDLQKAPLGEVGEDGEEEEKDTALQASKKKKKTKKKKPAVGTSTNQLPITPAPVPFAHEELSKTQAKSSNGKQPSPKVATKPSPAQMATVPILPLSVEPSAAQSARSYIKTEHLDVQKSKTKTRSDQASIFSNDTKDKKADFFAKFRIKNTKGTSEEEQKLAKQSWFTKLSKKASKCMHQLLKTSPEKGLVPMKWDDFVTLMAEMGFEYHPETSGSSVRFDPPDKRDRSFIIHKPHPDSTLQPMKLRGIASKLNKYYGWNKEEFLALTK